jgi:hypothetical protein
MWVYIVLFLLISLFCYLKVRQENAIRWGLITVLILIAGFGSSISVDYKGYLLLYNEVLNGIYRVELTYILISFLSSYVFHSPIFIFLLYAFLGVTLKAMAIKKLTNFWFFSILIYFSYYYFLHEMTQIRVGVAAALVLYSIPDIYEKRLKSFFLLVGIAILFHYSAIVAIPLYFLKKDKIHLAFYFLVPIAYTFYFFDINIVSLINFINIDIINFKFQFYLNRTNTDRINVFNFLFLIRYLFCSILLWKRNLLYENNHFSVILIKIYILSLFSFVALSDIPAFAFRISQLLGIVEIVLIPLIIYIIHPKIIGKIIVGLIGILFLYLTLFYEKLVPGYF